MRRMWIRLDRLRRRLGLDRNDLRRRIDRMQWAFATILLMIFLAVAPAAATSVADRVYATGMHTEAREAATRRQVDATIVDPAEVSRSSPGDTGRPAVRMRWPAPDGSYRTGYVPYRSRAARGASQRIWIDDTGAVTVHPRRHVQTVGDAVYAAGGTALAIGTLLLVAYGALRHRCDRRRAQLWENEWTQMDRGRAL
jgi:hypothetical protein